MDKTLSVKWLMILRSDFLICTRQEAELLNQAWHLWKRRPAAWILCRSGVPPLGF